MSSTKTKKQRWRTGMLVRKLVMYATGMTATEKALLLVMSDYCSDGFIVWPSQQRLARYSGMTRRSIIRTIKNLTAKSILIPRPDLALKRRSTNRYQINIKLLAKHHHPEDAKKVVLALQKGVGVTQVTGVSITEKGIDTISVTTNIRPSNERPLGDKLSHMGVTACHMVGDKLSHDRCQAVTPTLQGTLPPNAVSERPTRAEPGGCSPSGRGGGYISDHLPGEFEEYVRDVETRARNLVSGIQPCSDPARAAKSWGYQLRQLKKERGELPPTWMWIELLNSKLYQTKTGQPLNNLSLGFIWTPSMEERTKSGIRSIWDDNRKANVPLATNQASLHARELAHTMSQQLRAAKGLLCD